LFYRIFSGIIEHMFGLMDEIENGFRAHEAALAALLVKVAEYDRSGEWALDGFASAAAALRSRCRMNVGVARSHVQLARKLEKLPAVAEAFGLGDISRAHASVIAEAYTPARAAEISNVEPQLVAAARDHTPHEVGGLVRFVTDAIDGDGGAASDEAQHARRGYSMSSTLDGMLVTNGTYDHLDGLIHQAAIDAEMQRDFQANDPRTTTQRRADAHTNIMRRALENGELGDNHGVRPHVTAVVDLGEQPDLAERVRRDRHRNGFLSETMLELIACDCDVSRVIMAGKSEILDLGRATRNPTTAQWKALVLRDQHCQAPGCDRPPSQCQAHHIWHWTRGGPTDLENLKLYCTHHHRQEHIEQARARAG
jgi:uncharacterized protein DUF222/HNH endonuclease